MASQEIKFLDKSYTQDSLKSMEVSALLELRNLIATNLGVATIKGFPDQNTAVDQTWKALERYESTAENEGTDVEGKPTDGTKISAKKAPKEPKEPKERKLAKSADAKLVKRPTKKMFSKITKTGEHNGTQGRQHRWPNYKDGMTLVDVIEGQGTEPWDVHNWVKQGIMTLTEPTDAEYEELKAAWYKKHGLTDPELSKAEKEKAKAEAKAKKDEEAKAKKEAAEKAKADAEAAKAAKANATTS
jgi:hypothetical protein